jgi:hypothetical protein
MPLDSIDTKTEWVLAGDASSKIGAGFHLYKRSADGTLTLHDRSLLDHQVLWKNQTRKRVDIYLKELYIAVISIQWFHKKYPGQSVHLITDNSAVAWGLRSSYTTNLKGNRFLGSVTDKLHLVNVVQVVSKDNASDCVSRNDFSDYDQRLTRMQIALTNWLGGRKTGRPDPRDGSDSRIQHLPPKDSTDDEWLDVDEQDPNFLKNVYEDYDEQGETVEI